MLMSQNVPWQNVRQALLFLTSGGAKHLRRVADVYTPDVLYLFEQDPTLRKLVSLAGANDTYVGHENDPG
jgi:hypothetical protein